MAAVSDRRQPMGTGLALRDPLPWGEYAQESDDIPDARRVLDADHEGLGELQANDLGVDLHRVSLALTYGPAIETTYATTSASS